MTAAAVTPPNRPVVTTKLASTADELMQCYALRAAVFVGEQQCPYREEFDGEPAASMRVRWFAGFAGIGEAPFRFWDHEHAAFAADLEVPVDAPTVLRDPMVLTRPEDQLDGPGLPEESMRRRASNPPAG